MLISIPFGHYFIQLIFLLPLVTVVHYFKSNYLENTYKFYTPKAISTIESGGEYMCKCRNYENALLELEITDLKEKIAEIEAWKLDFVANISEKLDETIDTYYTDQIGMFDYASKIAGASIISTPDTNSYPTKHVIRLFGTINWILDSEPKFLIQPRNLPGECYAFYGNRGRIRIKLSQSVVVTHVSLEHFKVRTNNSEAPKHFQVLGLNNDLSEVFMGNFTYNLFGKVIQTFNVIEMKKPFHAVELRILNNYGNAEFTCVYRFRVHSINSN